MRFAARISVFALAVAAGCGGSSTAPSSSSGSNNPPPQQQPPGNTGGSTSSSITVQNNYFDPSSTTVAPGTAVKWTWDTCSGDGYGGQLCASHNIVFDDGASSGSQSAGSWSRTFNAAGTYKYHCLIHGSAMSGTVVVQ